MSDPTFSDAERAKFAGLVARIWSDPALASRYHDNGRSVLAEAGIELAAGVELPVIPERPEGDISIEELETVSAGSGTSTLLCVACPVSCFSSFSD